MRDMKEKKSYKKRPTREEFNARCKHMFSRIADEISRNILRLGESLPPESQLAKRYSLSRESVRQVLSQLEAQGIVSRIKGKGVIAGQKQFENHCDISIGIIVPPEIDPATADLKVMGLDSPVLRPAMLLDSVETALLEAGAKVHLYPYNSFFSDDASKALEALSSNNDKGLVIPYWVDEHAPNLTEVVTKAGIDAVMVSSFVPMSEIAGAVCFSNYQIGKIMSEHLISRGHEETAFIGDMSFYWARERCEGIKDAFAAHSLSINENLIFDIDIQLERNRMNDCWRAAGREGARRMLEHGCPSSVFCVNDATAAGVYDIARETGVSIPGDLSVVGCDNDYNFSSLNLTTIKLNCVKAGQTAADMLMRRLKGKGIQAWPTRIELTPTLVEKNSVRSLKNWRPRNQEAIA